VRAKNIIASNQRTYNEILNFINIY